MTRVVGSFGDRPLVRLVESELRCFDEACDERFGRRTDEGFVMFLPEWVYQSEVWHSRPIESSRPDGVDVEEFWRNWEQRRELMWERVPGLRNAPDPRLKFVSSTLPAPLQCPGCGYLQIADPRTLGASEARTSLAKGPGPLRRVGRRLRHPRG